ncbi:PIN domain-containing protein [Promicromonospora vindobonensis]|uniref:Ribonuclease VapC n=1 Tax=Promicromonospora vindobonensis TaxID=195748 RepID=A0ABW5VNJ5_9MICO
MAERLPQGLLDTSVVIDLENIPAVDLPVEVAICVITLAELAAAPAAAADTTERARRQDRLQRTEAAFDPIPFDIEAARSYARVYAAAVAQGRKPRRRLADLLIAAVALTEGLPVITRNPDDFIGLEDLIDVATI